jgi:hypothetical protein
MIVLILHFVESVLENSYDFNIGVWGWPKKGPDIFVVIPKVNLRIRIGTGYG